MESSLPENRIAQAAALLRQEAADIQQRFNNSYPTMVQAGQITGLCRMHGQVQLLLSLANKIDSI